MIGGIIILLTLILGFIEKPHLFKQPVQKEKVVIIIIIIGTAIFSISKDRIEADEQESNVLTIKKSARTIDSLKTSSDIQKGLIIHQSLLIDSLRLENRMAAVQHQDSLKDYHYKTTAILAKYGLKVDTLRGEVSKIDIQREQAHLALFADKDAGFKASRILDTFNVKGWVTNDGTGVAFGVRLESHLLFQLDSNIYRYRRTPEIQRDDYDDAPNRAMQVTHGFRLSPLFYDKIESFVLVMTGYYYIDYQRKKKQNIRLGVIYVCNEKQFYPVTMSVDSIMKVAKFADFLYK